MCLMTSYKTKQNKTTKESLTRSRMNTGVSCTLISMPTGEAVSGLVQLLNATLRRPGAGPVRRGTCWADVCPHVGCIMAAGRLLPLQADVYTVGRRQRRQRHKLLSSFYVRRAKRFIATFAAHLYLIDRKACPVAFTDENKVRKLKLRFVVGRGRNKSFTHFYYLSQHAVFWLLLFRCPCFCRCHPVSFLHTHSFVYFYSFSFLI